MNNIYDRIKNPELDSGWDIVGKKICPSCRQNVIDNYILRNCSYKIGEYSFSHVYGAMKWPYTTQIARRLWIHVYELYV